MKSKSVTMFAGIGVIVTAILYLIYTSIGSATVSYSLSVDQALGGNIEQGKFYRIEGEIDVNNAQFDGTENPVELKFAMYDEQNPGKRLAVIYNDVKPDNFAEATSAVVEGKFNPDGTFQAEKLMLKCPTKYEKIDGTGAFDIRLLIVIAGLALLALAAVWLYRRRSTKA